MCRRVECERCGCPTFAGCGMHVEQVLGEVSPAERCRCRESAQESPEQETRGGGAWLRALLARRS